MKDLDRREFGQPLDVSPGFVDKFAICYETANPGLTSAAGPNRGSDENELP
jgi:hypothetical protein